MTEVTPKPSGTGAQQSMPPKPSVPPPASKPPKEHKSHQVTYVPGPGDPAVVTWRGVQFVAGKPQAITDESMYEAALTNPAFNCDGQDVAAERAERDRAYIEGEDKALEANLIADEEACKARQAAEVEALKVRHTMEVDALKARRASLADDVKRLRAKRELEVAQRLEREALDAAAADAAKRKADLDAKHAAETAALETGNPVVVVAPVAA